MKAKDKKKSFRGIILIFIIILFTIFIVYNLYFQKNQSYAVSGEIENQNIEQIIATSDKINIDELIKQNVGEEIPEEYRQEEVVLEYLTEYVTNPELAKGESYVIQEGVKGTQKITYKKIHNEDNTIGEEQISAVVVKPAFNQIIEIGTGTQKTKQVVNVGDEVTVTSDELTVTLEPQEDSKKMTVLKKDDKIKVLKIQGDWYYISYKNTEGWVKKAATKAIIVEVKEPSQTQTTNKTIQKLDFNMQLNKPSGLTLEQFQKVLSDGKDKNGIFAKNAQYFYYIEQQYKINGLFVAAIGIHESAWGTSQIALNKKNLFGYGAYDSNPYNGAYQFSQYSECIDLIARVLIKYYLNQKGASIYGGEKAEGTYYNGATLTGVNKRYATDKNWAKGVYAHMQYLYGKL